MSVCANIDYAAARNGKKQTCVEFIRLLKHAPILIATIRNQIHAIIPISDTRLNIEQKRIISE